MMNLVEMDVGILLEHIDFHMSMYGYHRVEKNPVEQRSVSLVKLMKRIQKVSKILLTLFLRSKYCRTIA